MASAWLSVSYCDAQVRHRNVPEPKEGRFRSLSGEAVPSVSSPWACGRRVVLKGGSLASAVPPCTVLLPGLRGGRLEPWTSTAPCST